MSLDEKNHHVSYKHEGGIIEVVIDDFIIEIHIESPRQNEAWIRDYVHWMYAADRCKQNLPPCKCPGAGEVIVNAASDVGLKGKKNLSVYSASKFAIVGLTEALGKELAPNIKVYSIAPRSIATGMSKLRGNSPVLVAKIYVKALKNEIKVKSGGHIIVGKEKDADKAWKKVPSVNIKLKK